MAALAADDLTIDTKPGLGILEIRFKNRPLLEYWFKTNQFKPYVHALYTLRGDNVLLDAPPDHLHHHGLMFAVKVNDINFWEEAGQPGWQVPVRMIETKTTAGGGGHPEARFTQLIHWVAGKDRALPDTSSAALLVERRTLALTVNEAANEIALTWQSAFEVGRDAGKVTLSGAGYHGLGLRFRPAFNHVAERMNSDNQPYSAAATFDVTPARWTAFTGKANGQDVTVALFDHPSNRAGNKFFSMLNAFAYVSATQGLDKTTLAYAAGERFDLRYLVTVAPAPQSREFLERRFGEWIQPTRP